MKSLVARASFNLNYERIFCHVITCDYLSRSLSRTRSRNGNGHGTERNGIVREQGNGNSTVENGNGRGTKQEGNKYSMNFFDNKKLLQYEFF